MAKALTRVQIEYASNRLKQAAAAAQCKEIATLGDIPIVDAKDWSINEKNAMIRTGKATLRPDLERHYGYLHQAFTYPPYKQSAAQKAAVAARAKYDKQVTAIIAKYEALLQPALDKIYLLGSDEALEFLGEFEAKLAAK